MEYAVPFGHTILMLGCSFKYALVIWTFHLPIHFSIFHLHIHFSFCPYTFYSFNSGIHFVSINFVHILFIRVYTFHSGIHVHTLFIRVFHSGVHFSFGFAHTLFIWVSFGYTLFNFAHTLFIWVAHTLLIRLSICLYTF